MEILVTRVVRPSFRYVKFEFSIIFLLAHVYLYDNYIYILFSLSDSFPSRQHFLFTFTEFITCLVECFILLFEN